MTKTYVAYSESNRIIKISEKAPEGASILGESNDYEKLKQIVEVNAQHSRTTSDLLIPSYSGIQFNGNETEQLKASISYFSKIIEMRLNDQKGWPAVTQA